MKIRVPMLLLIAFSSVSPALSQGTEIVKDANMVQFEPGYVSHPAKSSVESDMAFFKALSTLESKNQGSGVEENFKKFIENPDKYLALLTKKYLFTVDHSPVWIIEFGAAAECAKKSDWNSCRLAATTGIDDKADEPVLFFLRAIAYKKLNKNELSFADLERLYAIKSRRKDIQDHNKYYQPEERDFFNFLLI